jgi:hypothetical protein
MSVMKKFVDVMDRAGTLVGLINNVALVPHSYRKCAEQEALVRDCKEHPHICYVQVAWVSLSGLRGICYVVNELSMTMPHVNTSSVGQAMRLHITIKAVP